jgi:diguanylate cyclase (GGDEF)-like protein/PAS domain S-box-containing protein
VPLRLIAGANAIVPPEHRALDAAAFEALFEHAGGMLAILDGEGRFIAVNRACQRVLGHEPGALVGRSLLDFVQSEPPPPGLREGLDEPAAERGPGERPFDLLARHRHGDGTWRWLLWSGTVHAERWYASARDVTDWIKLEDRVGRDPLTQLPNRDIFTDELTQALARQERSGRRLAVLFIDIDSLKRINDSIGHKAGDRLVAQVAARLRLAVRTGDVVARLGGDEFGILLESLASDVEAVTVARRALAVLEEPIELGGSAIAVSASIGISAGGGSSETASGLIHQADIAMYQAKAAGRNRYAIFDAELRAEVERRVELERDLRAALEHGRLELRYEPIVDLASGLVIGYEASVHWQHPDRGLLAPREFMALAEQSGLSVPLGARARSEAADQLATWRAAGHELFAALGVSPRQLADPELVPGARDSLERTSLPLRSLAFEVSEAALVGEPERAAARVRELAALGVRVALDEFGTGQSPLRHMIQLPFDAIKLDPAFIAELAETGSRAARAALVAIVAAARELGISVVAEGVSTRAQLDELRAAGCSSAQGPVFAPPAAAGDVAFAPYADRR